MKKCIITVVGKDSVGIIAKVCTYLAETNINILNISQTIVDGHFNDGGCRCGKFKKRTGYRSGRTS